MTDARERAAEAYAADPIYEYGGWGAFIRGYLAGERAGAAEAGATLAHATMAYHDAVKRAEAAEATIRDLTGQLEQRYAAAYVTSDDERTVVEAISQEADDNDLSTEEVITRAYRLGQSSHGATIRDLRAALQQVLDFFEIPSVAYQEKYHLYGYPGLVRAVKAALSLPMFSDAQEATDA